MLKIMPNSDIENCEYSNFDHILFCIRGKVGSQLLITPLFPNPGGTRTFVHSFFPVSDGEKVGLQLLFTLIFSISVWILVFFFERSTVPDVISLHFT